MSKEISILLSLVSKIKSAVASNCVCESLLVPFESHVSISSTANSPERSILSSSSSERIEIDPLASNLNLSSTIPFTMERFIHASLTTPWISTAPSVSSLSPITPLPRASNTWPVMIPFTVVSFFHTESKSNIIDRPFSAVLERTVRVPLPISQESSVSPILCCHPWPLNTKMYFCEPFSFSHC